MTHMTEDLTGQAIGTSKVSSSRCYEYLQTHTPNMYQGLASAKHRPHKMPKYKITNSGRVAKPILEEYDFKCHDEDETRRVRYVKKGLFTSKNSSVKSIKKVTPRAQTAFNSTKKVGSAILTSVIYS